MFKFQRCFCTNEEAKKLEEKITNSKSVEDAISCIPNNYPDYIKEEITVQIKKYFGEK